MSAIETVLYEVCNRVATITLNRPQVRNAFNAALRQDLAAAIDRALAEAEVRVIVLTGAGAVFSAGADIADLSQPGYLPQVQIEEEYKPILLAISQAYKPFISAINGTAAGIGSAFAMACDLTVMADDACIYQAFSNLSLIPDGGACWQLVHSVGRKRAYDLIVSGARISAQQCVEWGLANRVVAADALGGEAQAWAEELARQAPLTMRYAKQALDRVQQMSLADAITYEAGLQNYCVRSHDLQEGVQAFRAKRSPLFQGI